MKRPKTVSVLQNHVIKMNQDKKNNVCLFVRCSLDTQDYERQIRELKHYCNQRNFTVTKIIASKISGTKTYNNRPDLQELFESVKENRFSKVIVTEISRIGRNARDIRNTIDFLHSNNISILFKNLGGMESLDETGKDSFVTNIIISIYAELAQEEKRILTERIKSGLNNAREKGKKIGRPTGNESDMLFLKKYSKLIPDVKTLSIRKCMKIHNVSKNTVLKIKRALKTTEIATGI